MGFLDKALRAAKKVDADKVRAQVSKAVDKHGEKITGGIDKAAAAVDQRTGGKHSDKIAKARSKAKEGLEKLEGAPGDGAPGAPPAGPAGGPAAGPVDPTGPGTGTPGAAR